MTIQQRNAIIKGHGISALWTVGKIGVGVLVAWGTLSWKAGAWKVQVDAAQIQLTEEVQVLKSSVESTRELIQGPAGLRQEMAMANATLASLQRQLDRIEDRMNRTR